MASSRGFLNIQSLNELTSEKGVYIAPVPPAPRLPGVAMPMIHTALGLGISLYLERRVPASAQFLSRDNTSPVTPRRGRGRVNG